MTIVALGAPLSYRDWLAFPDDGHQYEVVEGIPVVNPSPNIRHQVVVQRLAVVLSLAAPEPLLVMTSPIDWVLRAERPAHVRQPDIVVVHPDQCSSRAIVGTPALAVEVLSPSSVERDVVTKRRAYARAGCPHYWLVDPAQASIVAFALAGRRYERLAHAAGSEALRLDSPFSVVVVPDALVRDAPAADEA
jgi:Uma2 family endonuclease